MNRRPHGIRTGGFTLVELLLVITIIIVIISFTVPAVTSVNKASELTRAAQVMTAQLTLARQKALTRNRTIEVRLYKMADPEMPGESVASATTWKVRGIQYFEVQPDGTFIGLAKAERLSRAIIIDSSTTLSSLLVTPVTGSLSIPRVGTSYSYYAFRFKPDGSTNLTATGNWFFTLHPLTDGDNRTTPPTNFITIQIEPVKGTLTMFRPS